MKVSSLMDYQIKIHRWVSPTLRAMADQAGRVCSVVPRPRLGIRDVAIGAAVTLLVIAGWRFYLGWRMGRIELTTEGEPWWRAQVLEEASDVAIGEPFDIATRAVVTLPEGDYRLRVDGVGRLGRTYRFAVVRGETQVHTISIDDGRLLGHEYSRRLTVANQHPGGAIPIAPLTWAIELAPGRADLIEVTERSLVCRDGATGTVRWGSALADGPPESNRDVARWIRSHVRTDVRHGGLLEPAPDLNGDGTGDLVWFAQDSPQLRAISGKDGSKLWDYLSQADGLGRDDRGGGATKFQTMGTVVAGEPAMTDVDRDGIPDLIATFIFSEAASSRRIVARISGRSGRRLWSHLTGQNRDRPFRGCRGDRPAVLVKGRRSTLVAYTDGPKWVGLDPASGEVRAGPIDLGFLPVCPVQHADLDGDGEPEVLALGPGEKVGQRTLWAFSVKSARELWAETVDEVYDQGEKLHAASSDRPWIVWTLMMTAGRRSLCPTRVRCRGLRVIKACACSMARVAELGGAGRCALIRRAGTDWCSLRSHPT